MKKYKMCVYAICKNEEKFVDRFMDSLLEIKDHIYILDTGSTDNTVAKFKARGAHVFEKKYKKFEFDKARNDSLKLVPEEYDICICLDIDDVIEPGFTKKIMDTWTDDTSQIRYMYYYTIDPSGYPLVKFMNNHIHKRDAYRWKYPIHEILEFIGENEVIKAVPELIIKHYPDVTKSRDFYLRLLEEAVLARPNDTRCIYLLAREYVNKGSYGKCIKQCHNYLKSPDISFRPEICKIMTYLSKSYRSIEYFEESILWADKAIEEVNDSREPYVEKIITAYTMKDYEAVVKYGKKALKIKDYNADMIESAACFDGTIEDYVSLAYYYLEDYDNAIKYIDMDIKQNPHIERLKGNRQLFVDAKKNKEQQQSI